MNTWNQWNATTSRHVALIRIGVSMSILHCILITAAGIMGTFAFTWLFMTWVGDEQSKPTHRSFLNWLLTNPFAHLFGGKFNMAAKDKAQPVGHHVQSYIAEPFSALQVVIDGSKDKVERIHAALGVLDFGAVTFIPHDHPPMFGDNGADESEDQICEDLRGMIPAKEAKKGAAGAHEVGAFPWAVVIPLVFSLIEKWLKK